MPNRTQPSKQLLIIANTPSANTQALFNAALRACQHQDLTQIQCLALSPFEVQPEHLLQADAVLLGTTENFGYMSGSLKDFFDRCYYPILEHTQGLPCSAYIRAGLDGTGTVKALRSITTGLRWNWVQEPLVLQGAWQEDFTEQVAELALTLAAGLDAGIY